MDIKQQILEILHRETKPFLLSEEQHEYFFPTAVRPMIESKKTVPDSLDEIRSMVAQQLPGLSVSTTIPPDGVGKQMSELWRQDYLHSAVLFLVFGKENRFVHNVAQATTTLLAPALLLEGTSSIWELALQSPALKWIVAPPLSAWKETPLMKWYRHQPASGLHVLGNIPLLFLEPTSAYQQNPQLKRQLWNTLSTLLSTST